MNAVLFGYFQADSKSPGANIPSQTVYTCLSHDIIAHEMTHAIVHRLRPYFIEATNLDVLAFHEAFSDIIALLQRFSYRDLLIEYIKDSHGDLKKSEMLVDLAQQFGYAIGSGKALRSALGVSPKIANLTATHEPHERGAILVSAVFDGFPRLPKQDWSVGIGEPYLLGSIAAVVLGGTSILGGRGSYLGTIAGSLLLITLIALITVVNIQPGWRSILFGALILVLLLTARESRGD